MDRVGKDKGKGLIHLFKKGRGKTFFDEAHDGVLIGQDFMRC